MGSRLAIDDRLCVFAWRRSVIRARHPPMQKTNRPTINDVARVAGVSKKTVSRVINRSPLLSGDTRERVEQVIADLGYIPNPQARALALRRNYLIGLVHDNPNAQTVMNVQQGMLEALYGTEFRSEEHTSELQSLMRTSYAVFCLTQ